MKKKFFISLAISLFIVIWSPACSRQDDAPSYLIDGSSKIPDVSGEHWPSKTSSICFIDADCDGDPDAFLTIWDFTPSPINTRLRLWLNDGLGKFTESSSMVPDTLPVTVTDGEIGDIDGDGDPDICLVTNEGTNYILLNNGSGFFSVTSGLGLPSYACTDICLSDIDKDGDLDAAVATSTRNAVFLNDGSGAFSVSYLTSGSDDSSCVLVHDVTRDGFADMIILNRTSPSYILSGDGVGNFNIFQTIIFSDLVFNGALGDLDGDTNADLIACLGSGVAILINDGSGNFTEASGRFPELKNSYPRDVALADIDLDGDIDAYIAVIEYCNGGAISDGRNRVLLNNGSGFFDESRLWVDPLGYSSSLRIKATDVDRDGDLDFLISNDFYMGNSLVLNIR